MEPSTALDQFWQWFRDNGERLRTAIFAEDEEARDEAIAELRDASEEVAPGLILEIGQPSYPGGPHELVVSADGRPERADAVKDFAASAPALKGWDVIAFRPRMEVGDAIGITIEDENIGPEDIWFQVKPDENGLILTLYVRGLTRRNERMRGLGATLLAQHTIGERDAMTLLSGLDTKAMIGNPAAAGLHPFGDLASTIDEEKSKKYPPPGSLPIEGADEWQNMQGTIDDLPVFVLLNTGLLPFAGHPDYDLSLVVTIPFHDVNEHGLPARDEEYHEVQQIEDRLSEALQEDQVSLLAVSVLTQGRRDMIFYTSNAEASLNRLEDVRRQERTHRIEADVERDTFWGRYRGFFPQEEEEV